MQSGVKLSVAALCLAAGGGAQAASGLPHEAWFYSTKALETDRASPERWCAFVTKPAARAAAASARFGAVESAWLRYRDHAVVRLVITSQSEDAFVEDAYTFTPDMQVAQIIRTGRYATQLPITVIFRPDARGHLQLTAASRSKVRAAEFETYFVDWPIYQGFAAMPFAGLIATKPRFRVVAACKTLRR